MSFDVFAGISVRFPSPSVRVPLGNVVYLGQLLPEPGQGLCPNKDFPALVFAGSPLPAASAWEDVEQACSAHEGGQGDGSCKPSLSPTSARPAWRGPSTPTPAKPLQPHCMVLVQLLLGSILGSSSPSPVSCSVQKRTCK